MDPPKINKTDSQSHETGDLSKLSRLLNPILCAQNSPKYKSLISEFELYSINLDQKKQELSKYSEKYASSVEEGLFEEYFSVLEKIETMKKTKDLQGLDLLKYSFDVSNESLKAQKILKSQNEKIENEYESKKNKLLNCSDKTLIPANLLIIDDLEASKALRSNHRKNYTLLLGELASIQKVEIMEQILGNMYLQLSYYQSAYLSMKELEPLMNTLSKSLVDQHESYSSAINAYKTELNSDKLSNPSLNSIPLSNQLEVQNNSYLSENSNNSTKSNPEFKGYLYLYASNSIRSTWTRKWYEIRDSSLVTYLLPDESDLEIIPLMLCKVKPAKKTDQHVGNIYGRFNVFELIFPQNTIALQAESESEMNSWIKVLSYCTENSVYYHGTPKSGLTKFESANFHDNRSVSSFASDYSFISDKLGDPSLEHYNNIQEQIDCLDHILKLSGNNLCADCGIPDPNWTVINYGIIVCINCCGIHRSFGVHVSKVRSLQLDKLEPEHLHILQRMSNSSANSILTHDSESKVLPSSTPDFVQAFISNKYITKKYVKPIPAILANGKPVSSLDDMLLKAISSADLPSILHSLILGADPNRTEPSSGLTPLSLAAYFSDFAAFELMLMWGADINMFVHPKHLLRLNTLNLVVDQSSLTSVSVDEESSSSKKSNQLQVTSDSPRNSSVLERNSEKTETTESSYENSESGFVDIDISEKFNNDLPADTTPVSEELSENHVTSDSGDSLEKLQPAANSDLAEPNGIDASEKAQSDSDDKEISPSPVADDSSDVAEEIDSKPDQTPDSNFSSDTTEEFSVSLNEDGNEVSTKIDNETGAIRDDEIIPLVDDKNEIRLSMSEDVKTVSLNSTHASDYISEFISNSVLSSEDFKYLIELFKSRGGTALFAACCNSKNGAIAGFMIRKNANPNIENTNGQKAIDIATAKSNVLIVMTLRYSKFLESNGSGDYEELVNSLGPELAIPIFYKK
ncbi:Arf-GAP with coiled-coil, ANK repeat and PH domain-containing protein 3 [Smittium culicis]|uniref:Arf-GAP with coiled-coil, ANK repeat and PH domain-containing protein 3 n=1 Tax=Smittium culicis TaxID=133412 RepID=A0A1R1Y5C2_9FUNG|nr:Arf-GAP with coiled-coil, ANK repeat and PH domain-containing protein 3 [Smittium culicis]